MNTDETALADLQLERLDRLKRVPLVPVIQASSSEIAIGLSRALVAGGIRNVEVAVTVPQALRVLAQLKKEFGDDVCVGAGMIKSSEQVTACIDAGAEFLASAGLVPGLLAAAIERGALGIPGALSPSEILAAQKHGAALVKLFPCTALGGPSYLATLSEAFPDLAFMASGGVDLDHLRDYFDAGASLCELDRTLASEQDFLHRGKNAITERARRYVEVLPP